MSERGLKVVIMYLFECAMIFSTISTLLILGPTGFAMGRVYSILRFHPDFNESKPQGAVTELELKRRVSLAKSRVSPGIQSLPLIPRE